MPHPLRSVTGRTAELPRRFPQTTFFAQDRPWSDPARPDTGMQLATTPGFGASLDPALDGDLASAISRVRQVAARVGELEATVRGNEELIYEQRQGLAKLQAEKQTVSEGLIEAARIIEVARERAERAETSLRASDAEVRRLEEHSVSLRAHLDSLMGIVRDTLPGGDPVTPVAAALKRSA